MPSRVPGNSSCTAWASTCAAECRITARPSALAAGTATTSASSSGVQARSLRSPEARSRTTTAPSGPLSGTPASLSACTAVVPAATRIGAVGVGEGAVDTGGSSGVVGRPANGGPTVRVVPCGEASAEFVGEDDGVALGDPAGLADLGVDAQAVLGGTDDVQHRLPPPQPPADPGPFVHSPVQVQHQVGPRVVGRAALGDVAGGGPVDRAPGDQVHGG